MPRQPLAHLWMLVGRIVVDDGVDHLSHGDLRLNRIEEADELLVAMALHVAANDGPIEDVERCEQRGGAVTFVVVRHRPGAAWLHRQPRLGTVERLDLALFVDRENNRMGGRIDVEADDIRELLGELRVRRQLERAYAMRRELVGFQDTLHRTQAHSRRLREHPSGPVGCFPWRRSQRQLNHPLHGGRRKWLFAGLARLVAREPFSAMNRACHRHTTGFDLPDRRMISAVPQPSAVARMMLARQTCFCGALRSEMIASSRWRSARVTFTTIPALMMRACTASDNLGIV